MKNARSFRAGIFFIDDFPSLEFTESGAYFAPSASVTKAVGQVP